MNESNQTPKQRAAAYITGLRRMRNDRGKLAALRRSLTDNPRLRSEAWPIIIGLGGQIDSPAYTALAGLFATHPEESTLRNFGETCRAIAAGTDGKIPDSFETRFRRLIVSDVTGQLRAWVRLAASKSVGINYESLLADLLNWPWYADDIRVKWAKSFWHANGSAKQNEAKETATP
jgi:CRISPR type I-E-associated protein CasB/Cse2